MAWEKRGRRRYYFRSVREGTVVRKLYFGCGLRAQQAAAEDAEVKARRAADRAELKRLQALLEEPERLAAELDESVNVLVEVALYGAGLRCRKGEWRRKRGEEN